MKLRLSIITCAMLVLAACAQSQLHQRLEDKSPEEKRDILARACHKEASPPLTQNPKHVANTNKLCDLMIHEIDLRPQP